jgi:molybdate transport system substrate-binding protein
MRHIAGVVGLGLAAALAQAISVWAQFGPGISDAKPSAVRVVCTAALRLPAELVSAAETAIGKPIVIQYGSARGNLKDLILNGQDFEVAILLPDVNEEIFRSGKTLPETHEIGRVPIGFGLRGDVPPPDLSTPGAVKAALLNARSIKYAPTGAALLTVKNILSRLQIGDQIRDNSGARGEAPLGPGEYEINIYPSSEIIPNSALKNMGPVIADLQVPAILQAVIGRNANDEQAAHALITFLQGPQIDATLKASGIAKSVVHGTLR